MIVSGGVWGNWGRVLFGVGHVVSTHQHRGVDVGEGRPLRYWKGWVAGVALSEGMKNIIRGAVGSDKVHGCG